MLISESYIEGQLKKLIKKYFPLYLLFKFKAISFNGVPDRILILPGKRIYFIELKKPKGGELSPIQKVMHKLLNGLGFPVIVIYTMEQLKKFIIEIAL